MRNSKSKTKKDVQNKSTNISIAGDATGNIIVGDHNIIGYSSEKVAELLTQINKTFQPRPFDGHCPYKGLDVFEEEDADLFFGRDRLVEDLVRRVKESRTVFVTGPSGSGKSSLVRAGLFHSLKRGIIKNSDKWLYETIKPGRNPFEALAFAFSRLKSPELGGYFSRNIHQPNVILECAESALSERQDQRLVLFIDQFEEIFTQVNKEIAGAFIQLITNAVAGQSGRVIILFCMRSDFIPNCATYPELNTLLNQQFIQIGAMQAEELVSAIAQPALRVGLRIDPDLIAQIINDMKGEPGALPLMQFTLKDLFDDGQGKGGMIALTLDAYLQHGGIQKSLERHADAAFGKLEKYEQDLARNIFSGLIEIGRGTQDSRRTALFEELIPANTSENEVEAIVQKLADARLITTDEQAGKDTITISHEKLIDAWPWLKKLVNENREVIALQNEIKNDAKEWEDHHRDASYLYTGARLSNVNEKLKLNKLILSGTTSEYIHAGQSRQRRGRFVLIGSISIVFALLVSALVIFASLTNEANKQKNIAHARELAAISVNNLDLDPELSLLLAMESLNRSYTLQGEDALRRALLSPPVELTLHGHLGAVYSVAYDHDGTHLVTASEDETARIWDAKTGSELKILGGHSGAVRSAVFSPNGQLIATAGTDGIVGIWDANTGEQLGILDKHKDSVYSVDFSPNGQYIVTASNDGTVRVWNVEDGDEVYLLHTGADAILDATFSPNGRLIAAGGNDRTISVWDAATGQLVTSFSNSFSNYSDAVGDVEFSPDSQYILTNWVYNALRWDILNNSVTTQYLGGHTFYVTSVAFNPSDGRQVVTASRDHTARIWDTESASSIGVLRGHSGTVYDIAFDINGDHLATASEDQTVRIWNIAEWRKRTLIGHTDTVTGAAYSVDGKRIATTSEDGTIRIWDAQSGRELKMWQYPGWLANGIFFSPDNKQVITASDDGTWRIWKADTGEEIYTSTTITNIVHDARFSPDGTRIITTNRDTFGYIWDAVTKQLLVPLDGHTDWVASGVFSRDGKWVATASADGTARLWDAQTGKELRVFSGHSGLVLKAAFSSDGKRLVTASVDGTARIWDIETGDVLHVLKGHTAEVTDAVFSPNDQYVATSSRDNTARLWNAATGNEVIQLFGHTDDLRTVGFSPDGRYLLTSSLDGTARIYPVYFEDVLAVASSLLSPREFSCDEYLKYFDDKTACFTPTATLKEK